MIKLVDQISDRNSQVWFTGITIEVDATDKMKLKIGGQALVPQHPGESQQTYDLSAQVSFVAPQEGINNHVIMITWEGALVLDPGPTQTDLAGQVCWFDLPAGTTDLNTIEISQLIHVDPPVVMPFSAL